MSLTVGMVGARGYVGEALLRLLVDHPELEPAWIASRSQAGQSVSGVLPEIDLPGLEFEEIGPGQVASRPADVVVLALPNGLAEDYVTALRDGPAAIIDLSADYRIDESWAYGLPELGRSDLNGARRVANPGCYATCAQLALAPLIDELAIPPVVFGVSGYSGAGRTTSIRNDPARLKHNLMPYALSGHIHEREISHRLGTEVRLSPHVADFFRGISLTISATLDQATDADALMDRFADHYQDEPLIKVTSEIPELRQVQNRCGALIGGFTVDQRNPVQITYVACLDNLLKGAASQALQNINRMCGRPELEGIPHD
jgi:N-acetyl-gamma-glutamyl-phosphate reductase